MSNRPAAGLRQLDVGTAKHPASCFDLVIIVSTSQPVADLLPEDLEYQPWAKQQILIAFADNPGSRPCQQQRVVAAHSSPNSLAQCRMLGECRR